MNKIVKIDLRTVSIEDIWKLEISLRRQGITFDTGLFFIKWELRYREWFLDWSLKAKKYFRKSKLIELLKTKFPKVKIIVSNSLK